MILNKTSSSDIFALHITIKNFKLKMCLGLSSDCLLVCIQMP